MSRWRSGGCSRHGFGAWCSRTPARAPTPPKPRLLGETTRRDRPDLEDAVRRLIVMNAPGSIAAALAALRDRPDSTALLPSIDVPALVIAGDEDVVTPPAEADILHRALAGSTLVVLQGVGHL
jgi:pimeloyl-ACP methyl ester carboxylesterase